MNRRLELRRQRARRSLSVPHSSRESANSSPIALEGSPDTLRHLQAPSESTRMAANAAKEELSP